MRTVFHVRHDVVSKGRVFEVSKAYSMATGRRDHVDELAGCEAEVLEVPGGADVLVWVKGLGEVWINIGRLKLRKEPA
jgi:hypothetical protein